MLEHLSAGVVAHAAAWWVPLVVLGLAAFDGFFPPVPSESVVIGLAAIGASTGEPDLWLLGLAAAVGAFCGDNLTYTLGRHSPLRSFAARHPHVGRALDRGPCRRQRHPSRVRRRRRRAS